MRLRVAMALTVSVALPAVDGCSSQTKPPAPVAVARFDLASPLTDEAFFDFPYPSDLRLRPDGAPALDGFPNPEGSSVVDGFKQIAVQRKGFPSLPVAYFRFEAPIHALQLGDVIPAEKGSPILLIDVDPNSKHRGELVPLVATVPPSEEDPYVPPNLLAVAARPGFVLRPRTAYAFVVKRALGDAVSVPLEVPNAMKELLSGRAPAGPRGEEAKRVYAPLVEALGVLGVPADDVAVATVFTTGDVVEDTSTLTRALADQHKVTLEELTLAPNNDAVHDRFCRVSAKVSFPQFQKGVPPFDTEGLFELGPDGVPVKQRDEIAPITITLPKQEMPAGGFPLILYVHGSGGRSSQHAHGDDLTDPESQPLSKWPSYQLAQQGFAVVGAAMPVSPDRLPNADGLAYLNLQNLKAMRDTFRQGVAESRMLLDALENVTIPAQALLGCAGIALPQGETAYRFKKVRFHAQGQSMGGMYTNFVGAVDPRIEAVVPTGAGGFWSYFILETTLVPGASGLLGRLIGTGEQLSFVHPVLHLAETGWEPIDPMVYMPRLARRPLPGHPTRPIFEAVGKGDSYFPTTVFDAMALAYGNVQAGGEVWPTMQPALSLAGLGGIVPLPLENNLTSEAGATYTGGVVQYDPPAGADGHQIYRLLPDVQYQYACFHKTFQTTGRAIIAAPQPLGSPCP